MSATDTATTTAAPSLVLIDQQHVIRERVFMVSRPSLDVATEIVRSLLSEKMTGKVTLNLSQGSIQNIKVEERSQIFLDNSPHP